MQQQTTRVGPTVVVPRRPRISPAYDTYWRFAAERQHIYFRRLSGLPQPWTSDSILSTYRFTNVYRAADRVSQYLIRHIIYDGQVRTREDLLFRILIFKVFNKIETWQSLQSALGDITVETYDFALYDRVLSGLLEKGSSIYSAAYIMPPPSLGEGRKHQNHLRLIEKMMREGLAGRLSSKRDMQGAFDLLRSYVGIGDFLAYQYAVDVNYSELTSFGESQFVVAGPGAKDGIRKCFISTDGLSPSDVIRYVTDRQEIEFNTRGLSFQSLWGRPLQLIDCQNLFCEVDKYARVAHPNILGHSGRVKIKQRLQPKGTVPSPWFPPAWGLNEKIESAGGRRNGTR